MNVEMNFNGPVYGVTPNAEGQQILSAEQVIDARIEASKKAYVEGLQEFIDAAIADRDGIATGDSKIWGEWGFHGLVALSELVKVSVMLREAEYLKSCIGWLGGKVTPNVEGQRIIPLDVAKERTAFEQWYTTHAFDYESSPIGSRDCGLQWKAWLARAQQQGMEVH